ncbi:MAG: Uma2 family endonuclease [Bryobacteraceae bacterium]
MATRTLISVQEYLATAYSPDCDYVDGEVQERNLGEWDHGSVQSLLSAYFVARRKQWKIRVSTEQRIQVSSARYRIPDVCVVLGEPDGQILRKPPFLCVEVSPEDRLSRVKARVQDFISFGVPNIWIIDPETKEAFEIAPNGDWRKVQDGTLRTTNPVFEVPLAEIFE